MRLGIVVYSREVETVWNALRVAVHARDAGDEVTVFFLGQGVEVDTLDERDFKITEYLQASAAKGIRLYACGTCLSIRNKAAKSPIVFGTLNHLYEIIRASDKTVTF